MFKPGDEVWRDVPAYEGRYQVSNLGRIRSLITNRVLKASPIPSGYLTVSLHRDGVQKTHAVHRLVATVFCDRAPEKVAVNHIDGVKQNNAAVNLEWVTPKENTEHGVRMGLICGAPRRVSDADRALIRAARGRGQSIRSLSREFRVDRQTVRKIAANPKTKIKETV